MNVEDTIGRVVISWKGVADVTPAPGESYTVHQRPGAERASPVAAVAELRKRYPGSGFVWVSAPPTEALADAEAGPFGGGQEPAGGAQGAGGTEPAPAAPDAPDGKGGRGERLRKVRAGWKRERRMPAAKAVDGEV